MTDPTRLTAEPWYVQTLQRMLDEMPLVKGRVTMEAQAIDVTLTKLAEIDALRTELERERLQLAACNSAAIANTPETAADRLPPEHPYFSAAYSDVCAAVDREMRLRTELAQAQQREACQWVCSNCDRSTRAMVCTYCVEETASQVQAERREAEAKLAQVEQERDKWLKAFNESEQFQNGPTKRAEHAETKLTALKARLAELHSRAADWREDITNDPVIDLICELDDAIAELIGAPRAHERLTDAPAPKDSHE